MSPITQMDDILSNFSSYYSSSFHSDDDLDTMDATMKKLRISIQALTSIEILAVAVLMIVIFATLRENS